MSSKSLINMKLLTTLKVGELRFESMVATEALGQLFEFKIEAISKSDAIKPEELLDKPASVLLEVSNAKRYFHGRVCAIGTGGVFDDDFGYHLVLRPWLWLLTKRTDTRVFQSVTVVEILKKVFEPFSPDYELQLKGEFPKYEYCVQYRETDFNFVSRLMEQEGVYYYFKHYANKHTMVIVNAPDAHEVNPVQAVFDYRESIRGELAMEGISTWRADKEIQPGQVVLRDYDFTKPKEKLESTAKAARKDALTKLELYDYPGVYPTKADGDRYSQLRMEELQAQVTTIHGSGSISGMACGYKFTLNKHPRKDQNMSYLVVSTCTELNLSGYRSGQGDTAVQCQFIAIEGTEVFRPRRSTPKPIVAGLHTAVVVGPASDEIYTDQHGRIKVQFHWDRIGKSDESSSCWVRVSTPWAGQNWGMISIPRIGQEVVVDFLEGDPDRPLVTGSVYNGIQKPPYPLAENATVSTNKSRTSKSGDTSNFNELRFEDKKGAEYVWFQAEKNFHQFVKNDATLLVEGKQERTVKKDLTDQIDGEVWTAIGKNSVTEVNGSHSLNVNEDMVTHVTGTIFQKSGADIGVKAAANVSVDAGGNVYIKAGANLVIEAGVMITLKAGSSSVVIGPSGVVIVGSPLVTINSGGTAGAGQPVSPKPKLKLTKPKQKKDPLN
jgi:type VI secretion system secreted protein VgrG